MFASYLGRRRGSDGSSGSSMASSDYDDSTKGSLPNSVPSLDHRSVESQFETSEDSSLFDTNTHCSVDTYHTTATSFDEGDEYDDGYGGCFDDYLPSQAVPATPQEFAEHFPSAKRLIIKHDDSTLDGNMNVRVDCDAPTRGEPDRRITLFHLRMYDLRDRDFSVRRYGRDCGREVAHVKRKFAKQTPQRPTLRKVVSSFRGKHEADEIKKVARVDSGYGSEEEEEEEAPAPGTTTPSGSKPTNTCTLEFSNYAHVELTRRGAKFNKKYEFEYWGKSYSWRRSVKTAGMNDDVSYHLVNNATNNVVARIRPDPLTPAMAAVEEAKGGFVPPCSMYINSSAADPVGCDNADVADVIVTTGLVMLADDSIKRKYQRKRTVQLVLPTTGKAPLKMNMEYVGPKRFFDEMFNRRPPTSRSQSARIERTSPSPPRRMFTS